MAPIAIKPILLRFQVNNTLEIDKFLTFDKYNSFLTEIERFQWQHHWEKTRSEPRVSPRNNKPELSSGSTGKQMTEIQEIAQGALRTVKTAVKKAG